MFHHHRPVFASVCSATLSAPFTLKVEGGGSTSSSNWATPLGFGRTASPAPALESEDERSPPSSPVHPFGKDTSIDSVQREQLLRQVRLIFCIFIKILHLPLLRKISIFIFHGKMKQKKNPSSFGQ